MERMISEKRLRETLDIYLKDMDSIRCGILIDLGLLSKDSGL